MSASKASYPGEPPGSLRRRRALGKYDAAISAEHKRGQALGYYINRSVSGAPGTFTARTREEADKQLEEVIARIAAKQAIEKAQKA